MTNEEAFTDAVACARCIEGHGPVHLGVHGIVQSAIALGATLQKFLKLLGIGPVVGVRFGQRQIAMFPVDGARSFRRAFDLDRDLDIKHCTDSTLPVPADGAGG